jgi:hypothetical protein
MRASRRALPVVAALILISLAPLRGWAQGEQWEDTAATAREDSLPEINDTTTPQVEEVAPVIDSISRRLIYDSSAIAVRRPGADAMKRFRDDDEFNYDRKKPRQPANLWERFMRWLNSLFDRMVPEGGSKTFWDWVSWIVVGVAVILVIMNMNGVRGIFFRKSDRNVSDFAEIEENIDEMNFDALIDAAVAERNFRRGVRLLYLKSLRDLSDRGLIAFRKEKTNQEYIAELRAAGLDEGFRYVTSLFEYVWYGDVPVNEPIFHSVRERFAEFGATTARHREAL